MDSEIVFAENWQYVPVDITTGNPIHGAYTGSNPEYRHSVVRRIRLEDKRVHSVDSGEIVKRWNTIKKENAYYTKWWDECLVCGKRFDETDYE